MTTMDAADVPHEVEWKMRLFMFLCEQVRDDLDKEQLFDILNAGLAIAEAEGTRNASALAREIAQRSPKAQQIGNVIANAIDELAAMNLATRTSPLPPPNSQSA
jgi:hypothetical protein